MPDAGHARELPRTIGFWGAAAIMVGIIIGGGIFATPTEIAKHLGSPAIILLFWLAGGAIALFGALTYAELATMFPQSGGVYVFLREGYGRAVAFTFGWTYLLITKPLGAAGIAIVFANHLVQLLGLRAEDPALYQDPRVFTIAILTVLTLINVRGTRLGAGVAISLTSVKFLVLIVIPLLAIALVRGDRANLAAEPAPTEFLLAIVPVMSAILWTYDGWSDVGAVAGEVRNPARTLPRAFLIGTLGVTAVYLVVNLVYMWMIPVREMRGEDNIAPMVMRRLLGTGGETAVLVMVLVSTLGSTHGSILTGARVSYQQARDGLLLPALGRVHPRFQTPAASLWIQLAMSAVCVWFLGTFSNLAGGFIFTMWIFYCLAGGALFILRIRRPDSPRPYRCWGYPIVPALFIAAAAGMTLLAIYGDVRTFLGRTEPGGPLLPPTVAWIGVLLMGFPAYALWTRVRGIGGRP